LVYKHILNGLEGVKAGKYFWGCKKDFFIKQNYPVISTTFWEEKSPRKKPCHFDIRLMRMRNPQGKRWSCSWGISPPSSYQ